MSIKQYTFSANWMLIEQVFRKALALFISVWLARYLGPDDFGLFAYATSIALLLASLSKLGLDDLLIKKFSKANSELQSIFVTSAVMKTLASLFIFFTSIIILSIYASQYFIIIALALFPILLSGFEIFEYAYISNAQGKLVSICKIFQLTVSSIVKIIFILTSKSLYWFLAALFFDVLFLSILYLVALKSFKEKSITPICFDLNRFSFKHVKLLLNKSWPLILSAAFTLIYMRSDQIMVLHMIDSEAAGIYAAASRISEAIYFIPMMVSVAFLPKLSTLISQSINEYHSLFQKLYSVMTLLVFLYAGFVFIFAEIIISTLYGQSYEQSVDVLKIHAISAIFIFWGVISYKQIVIENSNSAAFLRTIIGASLNIILNFVLIPKYGPIGAAISTCIAQFFSIIVYDIFDTRMHLALRMKLRAIFLIGLTK